jgi:hypothetical protein
LKQLHSREIGVASKTFKICGRDKPSLEDSVNLSDSDIIAAEIDSETPVSSPSGLPVHVACSDMSIVEDLEAALQQFAAIANDLKTN